MLKIGNGWHYSLIIGKNYRYLAALFQPFTMQKRIFLRLITIIVFLIFVNNAFGQPAWTINLLDSTKRSKKFEERKLGSEKMAEKKFTKIRHVFQNNFTHYNYYYNANNKINAVIERAKIAQKDDYTKLLSYYGFTLENTALQKIELDSVLYKATAGILLHDLRNDWIDNMYLLMGKAYFLKKDFDSAAATFQFINFNLFPRKKDEDDSRIVGTRDDNTPAGGLSIANKEKRNLLQKLTAQPPSRNDALIWMAHTLIEQNELSDASALINTLQHDPNLPLRLVNDLEEIDAYLFYKQNIYDSAASHLEQALSNSFTKQDRARSEFLLAQLFELTHQYDKATIYYNKASKTTTDPLMDIYAQLNNAKMMKVSDTIEIERSILNLAHMAKKDKFESYRDVIYYSAGELALQKPDSNEAVFYFIKSLKYNQNNLHFKNKAFLNLASIAYDRKQYKLSYAMYDSLQSGDTTLINQLAEIQTRRNSLEKIVDKINIIEREDSLQKLAAMPELERNSFITKMSKRLRKAQGVKEDELNSNDNGSVPIGFDSKKNTAADIFGSESSSTDWYFYNATLKAKGFNDFKSKWGNRTNADNWARKSAAPATAKNNNISNTPDMGSNDLDALPGAKATLKNQLRPGSAELENPAVVQDISIDGLMANIPLTPDKLKQSNTVLSSTLFELAKAYQVDLEDYRQAINTYDTCLKRYPDSLHDGAIYLGLYYCYNKLGITDKAIYYKNLVSKNFANSRAYKVLTNTLAATEDTKVGPGTQRYAGIYNLFIEGKFEEALSQKQKADSVYGNNYWSPQLLYIEAVYHIKQHHDSVAADKLNSIISLYPGSPLMPKAERMIDVLKRRKEIEKYLTALQITRDTSDVVLETREKLVRNDANLIVTPKRFDSSKAVIPKNLPVIPGGQKDSVISVAPGAPLAVKDSVKKVIPIITNGPFTFNAADPQNVLMVLDKVDGTYVNESKNAFTRYVAENFRQQAIIITRDAVDKDVAILIFSTFSTAENALQFVNKIRKAAPEEVSWLPAAKYSFLIISDSNLQLLKNNKNLKEYKGLLSKQYPGKF